MDWRLFLHKPQKPPIFPSLRFRPQRIANPKNIASVTDTAKGGWIATIPSTVEPKQAKPIPLTAEKDSSSSHGISIYVCIDVSDQAATTKKKKRINDTLVTSTYCQTKKRHISKVPPPRLSPRSITCIRKAFRIGGCY